MLRRHQCMHCLRPACASVCPVGALRKTPEGPVIYEAYRCLGCRYCMNACPCGAVIFGTRAEMLAEAKARIKARPDRYVDRVYGESEVGGTAFLTLSGIPFDQLGLPEPGTAPPQLFSERVMQSTMPFALAWATVLTGITGLSRLRERRMRAVAPVDGGDAGKEGGA